MGRPDWRSLRGALCRQTGENPFFAEEVVQSLLESVHLEAPRGSRRLVRSLERLRVPGSVQSVLSARIGLQLLTWAPGILEGGATARRRRPSPMASTTCRSPWPRGS